MSTNIFLQNRISQLFSLFSYLLDDNVLHISIIINRIISICSPANITEFNINCYTFFNLACADKILLTSKNWLILSAQISTLE